MPTLELDEILLPEVSSGSILFELNERLRHYNDQHRDVAGIVGQNVVLGPNGFSVGKAVAKTSSYSATLSDYIILVDATSGAVTITLPAASTATHKVMIIKKTDAVNDVTVDGSGSETIDGALTWTLSVPRSAITVACDGTAWHVLNVLNGAT